MSKQAWTELPTWHGEGEYDGECVCPRCGGTAQDLVKEEGMDEIAVIGAKCPKCGLEFAMVCYEDPCEVEGDCDDCGANDWGYGDDRVEWPNVVYTSYCNNCETGWCEVSAPLGCLKTVVRGQDPNWEYIGIDDAWDLYKALKKTNPYMK